VSLFHMLGVIIVLDIHIYIMFCNFNVFPSPFTGHETERNEAK